MGSTLSVYGQNECDSTITEPLDPLFCAPLDDNVLYLVVGGILLGLLKLSLAKPKKAVA